MVEAVFISIAKVTLLIVCLWICGKIISVYVANIFMALMLTTFSIFYLLFLTMEGTAQIGYRGINTIIVQSVTLFMTVAMMGISYQVMRLIAVGDSISGIASMTVILFMLEQVIENISGMAVAITSGGGLGQSKGGRIFTADRSIWNGSRRTCNDGVSEVRRAKRGKYRRVRK